MHAMTIRLEPDLYERLRTAAFERRMAMNAIVADAVRAELEEGDDDDR
jgi:predicted transcriptional regulator